MRNPHIAKLIAVLSIAVISIETQTQVHNILDKKWLPSSDGFELAANGSKSVFMYIRALLCTVPFSRKDIIHNFIAVHKVVENAITECTFASR